MKMITAEVERINRGYCSGRFHSEIADMPRFVLVARVEVLVCVCADVAVLVDSMRSVPVSERPAAVSEKLARQFRLALTQEQHASQS